MSVSHGYGVPVGLASTKGDGSLGVAMTQILL